jgi:glutaredoxin-like protein NrdH
METQQITIYTQPTCQVCHRLKKFLAQKEIEYAEKDVTTDDKAFAHLLALGFSTTPIIFIGDQVITGFDETTLQQLLSK